MVKRTLMVAGGLAVAAALQVGCLRKETIHTIYVMPDGAVTWGVMEKDVRSDEEDPEQRRAEEQGYLDSVRAASHEVAAAFESLGPVEMKTVPVRQEPPFLVYTEARFERVDLLSNSILERLRIPGYSTMEENGEVVTWRLVAYAGSADSEEADEEILALGEAPGGYRIIAVDCGFVDAQGFTIEDGGRLATPREISEEEIERNGGTVILSLSWRRASGHSSDGPMRSSWTS